jgi:hypothetical protein
LGDTARQHRTTCNQKAEKAGCKCEFEHNEGLFIEKI